MNKIVIGIIGTTVIILVGLVVLGSQGTPSSQPEVGESIALQPADHIPVGQAHPAYSSSPPTSGWHYADPAPWGVVSQPVADENAIHNLEHGGIWISYNPQKVDPTTINQLSSLVRGYPSKVLLSSPPTDDQAIAVASWGRLMKLDRLDQGQITQFIQRNKNKGPEQVPD